MRLENNLTSEEQLWFSKTYKTKEVICSACGTIAEFYETDNMNYLIKLNHENRHAERIHLNIHVAIGDVQRHEERHRISHTQRRDRDIEITHNRITENSRYSDFLRQIHR